MLVKEVLDIMQAAGIDAFIGNTSEELAMANLVSLPTMVWLVHPICLLCSCTGAIIDDSLEYYSLIIYARP